MQTYHQTNLSRTKTFHYNDISIKGKASWWSDYRNTNVVIMHKNKNLNLSPKQSKPSQQVSAPVSQHSRTDLLSPTTPCKKTMLLSTGPVLRCQTRSQVINLMDQEGYEWVSSVLRPLQHSIGYMGDGFYRSKDPTNSIKVLKDNLQRKTTTNYQLPTPPHLWLFSWHSCYLLHQDLNDQLSVSSHEGHR